jgi:hypothetical protein
VDWDNSLHQYAAAVDSLDETDSKVGGCDSEPESVSSLGPGWIRASSVLDPKRYL